MTEIALDLLPLGVLFLAALVHGAFGFGFPMLATPLLVLVMDLQSAIMLTLIPTLAINLGSIAGEKHRLEALRRFWPIPAFTIVGSLIGTQLLLSVDSEAFRLLLAAVLIGYLLAQQLKGLEQKRHVPNWGLALFGLSCGLMAGMVNVFAPLIVIFALYTRMPAHLMVATFNWAFMTSKTGQLLSFTANGAIDPQIIISSVWALPLVLGTLWIGIRIRRRLHPEHYRQLLRVALWLIALLLVWDSIRG